MTIERSIDITASPADVWRVMTEVERWPEWTKSVQGIRVLDAGHLQVGSRVEVRQPRLPVAVWSVTVLEAPSYFEWRNESAGLISVGKHRIEERGGSTHVTLSVNWSGPLAWLIWLVFGRLSAKYVGMEAAGLKRRCEEEGGRRT